MNCIDLKLDNYCHNCIDNLGICWIDRNLNNIIHNENSYSTVKENIIYYLNYYTKWTDPFTNDRIKYLTLCVKLHYPEHLSMLEKILLLT